MEKWLEGFAESGFRRSADIAHDLKTPLNVAVLNLELLRMRLAKIADDDPDEKISNYLRGIEIELRRMARIFDAYFVNATPPRDGKAPERQAAAGALNAALATSGLPLGPLHSGAEIAVHEARWREAARLIVEAVPKIFESGSVVLREETTATSYKVSFTGRSQLSESDLGKLFKFYYTDPSGNPDLALATARLIVETYGGTLDIRGEEDRATLELTLALGD